MKRIIIWIILLGLCPLLRLPGAGMLSAQTNNMQVMTYMSGEFAGSEFGRHIASIDFNGDGYTDLVVASPYWNPQLQYTLQDYRGKLYFYWGGPGFDNIPDFVIDGSEDQHPIGRDLINGGDMSGDGVEDLVTIMNENGECKLTVYFGRSTPQATPDVVLTYTGVQFLLIYPLGDINGDGNSDICICKVFNWRQEFEIYSDITTSPFLFFATNNVNQYTRLCGIGDVDSDGFDDCILNTQANPTGTDHNRIVLYYGNATFPIADSLVICEDSSNIILKTWSCPVGDVNGDGYGDFTAGSLIYDHYSQHLWLGGADITAQWDVDLLSSWSGLENSLSERGTGYPFIHGDLNGDGYEDVISFNHEDGYYDGVMFVWMGGANMNGSMDYVRYSITGYDAHNFGWSRATGDFNADGFCDIAAGAPWWGPHNNHNETGRVYILAGNANLHETTVANEDPLSPSIPQELSLRVFPNPLRRDGIVHMELKAASAMGGDQAILRIYNVRGQKVYQQEHITLTGKDTLLPLELEDLANGVYLCQVAMGHKICTTKLTIMK